MKKLILIVLLLTVSSIVMSKDISEINNPVSICPLVYLNTVKSSLEKKLVGEDRYNDKLQHCSASCMFAIHCPVTDVAVMGILKELADLLGVGNAEVKDLEADFDGIRIQAKHHFNKYDQCIKACKDIHPKKLCN